MVTCRASLHVVRLQLSSVICMVHSFHTINSQKWSMTAAASFLRCVDVGGIGRSWSQVFAITTLSNTTCLTSVRMIACKHVHTCRTWICTAHHCRQLKDARQTVCNNAIIEANRLDDPDEVATPVFTNVGMCVLGSIHDYVSKSMVHLVLQCALEQHLSEGCHLQNSDACVCHSRRSGEIM